jgi:glycosyltransferase involved in cell wall biosynthesis
MAVQQGVVDRVVFAGPVTGTAKDELLRHATILVLPSYSENFGNVVLEAMAQGCPVIVTPEVGAAPIVEKSGAGLVVDGEPAKLAAAIKRLLGDSMLRADMGRRGRDTVASSYSWTAVAARMRLQYGALLRVRA